MSSVVPCGRMWQIFGLCAAVFSLPLVFPALAEETVIPFDEIKAPAVDVKDAEAKTVQEMKPYTEIVTNGDVTFEMLPIPGGKFMMGSPEDEEGRKEDEGPQHEVEIKPFWMGKCEVTWDEYEVWMFALDIQRRELNKVDATDREKAADAYARPTKPYTDMTFGMGKEAARVESAIASTLDKRIFTADIAGAGPSVSTTEMTDAILAELEMTE